MTFSLGWLCCRLCPTLIVHSVLYLQHNKALQMTMSSVVLELVLQLMPIHNRNASCGTCNVSSWPAFRPEFCTCVHLGGVHPRHQPSTPSGLALSYSCDAEVHVHSADQAPYCFFGSAFWGGPQKAPWQWAWTPLWVLQTSHPGCSHLAMPSGVGHAVGQDPVHRYARIGIF